MISFPVEKDDVINIIINIDIGFMAFDTTGSTVVRHEYHIEIKIGAHEFQYKQDTFDIQVGHFG